METEFGLYFPSTYRDSEYDEWITDGEHVFYSCGRIYIFDELTKECIIRSMNERDWLTEEEWKNEFMRKLKKKMMIQCYSERGLAEAADISKHALSNYLNGKSIPNYLVLRRLARALHCDVNEISDFGYLKRKVNR